MMRFFIFACFVLLANDLQGQTYLYSAPFAFSTPSQERFTAGAYHKAETLFFGLDIEIRTVRSKESYKTLTALPLSIGFHTGDVAVALYTGPAFKKGIGLQSGVKIIHSLPISNRVSSVIQTGLSTTKWTGTDFVAQLGLSYKL